MSNKLLIAKPNFNPLVETNPDKFIFHSDFNTLKYATQGIFTLFVNQANFYDNNPGSPPIFPATWSHYKSGEISHNLGYVPYFAGYLIDIPFANTACQAPFAFGDFVFFALISVYADENKLYFTAHFDSENNSGIFEIDFSYRIFKNDLGL